MHPYMRTAAEAAQAAAVSQAPVVATDPPPTLETVERGMMREAAIKARKLFPGPVGEYLYNDLCSLESIGLRFNPAGLTAQMIRTVLDSPLPGDV